MNAGFAPLDYALPEDLIAKYALNDRPSARMLVVNRGTGEWEHRHFSDLSAYLKPGDLLVLNDSKVIPARIFAKRKSGGAVEVFLLKEESPDHWNALLRPSRRVKTGETILISEGQDVLEAQVLTDAVPGIGDRKIRFQGKDIKAKLWRLGHVPLPPYIQRKDEEKDRELYQTVYARQEGSVAAPTAGLHFDQPLLESLKQKGIELASVTLHVGLGTFKPIETEDVRNHSMHEEEYEISEETAGQINRALEEKRRVIACGTTSVRVLESACLHGIVQSGKSSTRLFIYGDYPFQVVSGLITNFHLPRSTLLCLVDSFLGGNRILRYYEEAIRERYRFYSYGDAMLVV